MKIEVKIPSVGESITSGILTTWHKKDGDPVKAGEVLFTLDTDKVATEVTADNAGTLRINVPEGAEVQIGEVVAWIEETSNGDAGPPEHIPPQKSAPGKKPEMAAEKPAPDSSSITSKPAEAKQDKRPAEPEAVRREPGAPREPENVPESRCTRKKLSPIRLKIAAQLVMAQQTAAILTTFNECDLGAVIDLRTSVQENFQKQHGVKLGFMSLFIKAAIAALKEVPAMNGRLDGDVFIQNHYYDIGVAIGTERGLVVPVIRDADQKSLAQIEQDLNEFALKAREGKIKIEDLQGGVFTISNGGVYGSLLSTPILNPPQSGILGMHKIQQRPVALNGEVVIRPMMYLALSYDHRVIDGREAVEFLIHVKERIESPARLLLEL